MEVCLSGERSPYAIIAAVASGGDVEVANDETVLHPGDKAIVVADEDVLDDVRLAFRGL